MSVLRKDPLTHGWVVFAEERFQPPGEVVRTTPYPDPEHCPFCEGHEYMTPPEVLAVRPTTVRKNGPGWSTRVIPNQFAVMRIEGKFDRRGDGLYDMMNGIGAHEVVIESPDHLAVLGEYSTDVLRDVLWTIRERSRDLLRDSRFRYIHVFRNYGEVAGATITHPHSQIVALPIVPRTVREEINQAHEYWLLKERCLFCDMISQDSGSKRLVYENDYFASIEPFASRFPFETWIYPKEHAPAFHAMPDNLLPALANAIQITMQAFSRAMSNPPYNIIFHSAPTQPEKQYDSKRARVNDYYHWHIEIVPRQTKLAGFELGTGFYVNSVMPEDAAEFLRATIEDMRSSVPAKGSGKIY